MNIREFKQVKADLELGSISGNREEMRVLRDVIDGLLRDTENDDRTHSRGIELGNGRGLTVSIGHRAARERKEGTR